MSSVNSISIQGIRSFNPKVAEKVSFQSPVTILLGHNGSGKTTIIESLKYITTGEMPAGSKGAAFVHDPKISDAAEVKGQIKLNFRTMKGEEMTLTRSVMVTQKKSKNPEFKTLDSAIRIKKLNDEIVSSSGKCVDLEREAIVALGVSKAVLTNVIFCHQEDSYWPMSEPKALKSRFDDIFSATKYIKALENMKKIQKEQEAVLGELREKVGRAEDNKGEAEQRKAWLDESETKIRDTESNIRAIETKLTPLIERKMKMEESKNKFHILNVKKGAVLAQKEEADKTVADLQTKIKYFYDGTDGELADDLRSFKNICAAKAHEKQISEEEKIDIEGKIKSLNDEKNRLASDKGRLEAEIKNNEENIKKRQSVIRETALDQSLPEMLRDTQVGEFIELINAEIQKLERVAAQSRADFATQESELEKENSSIVSSVASLESAINLKSSSMKLKRNEVKDKNAELLKINASQKKITQLEDEIQQKQISLTSVVNKVDETAVTAEINTLNEKKAACEKKLSILKQERVAAQAVSEIRTKLDNCVKDKATKERELENSLEQHRKTLSTYFPNVAVGNLRLVLSQFIRKKSDEIAKTEKELKSKSFSHNAAEVKRKNILEKIKEKDDELKKYTDNIFGESSGDENFDNQLADLSIELEKMRLDKGRINGAQYVYGGYIETLRRHPCCPLCKRDFQDNNEADSVVDDLKKKIENLPSDAESLSESIREREKKQEKLLKLQPTVDMAKNIRDVELPRLTESLTSVVADIKTIKEEISTIEGDLATLRNDEKNVSDLSHDVSLITSLHSGAEELTRSIENLQRQLKNAGAGERSLSDVQKECEDFQQSLDEYTKVVGDKTRTLNDYRQKIHKLKDEKLKLEQDRFKLTEFMHNRTTIESNIERLTNEISELSREIETAKLQLEPLSGEQSQVRERRNEVMKKKEATAKEFTDKISFLKDRRQKVDDLSKVIDAFEQSGKPRALTDCLSNIQRFDTKIDELTSRLTVLCKTLSEINVDLDGKAAKQRNLEDNRDFRLKRKLAEEYAYDLAKVVAEIEQLEATFGYGKDFDVNKFQEELEKMKRSISLAQGSLGEQQTRRDSLIRELESDRYKMAEANFRDINVDYHTLVVAVADLKKYADALEYSLLKYHEDKMKGINDSIRELWQKVYKGNDIDYIQVKAENDQKKSTDKRRFYNYRVVMYVNNQEMDMRGRCSAGQKVLASIIIRIALAEVFCTNCGILALDEPTTNLDAENIDSLADALAQLIDERSMQKNFQLVLITHDDNFVEMLLRRYSVEFVYRVSKDENGYSRVHKESTVNFHSQN